MYFCKNVPHYHFFANCPLFYLLKILSENRKETEKDRLYYDLDLLLNALMDSASEEESAKSRLTEAEEELRKAKSKYVFLCETSYTNRLLAEGFMQSAHDKYVRALTRKKAVEETLRNARQRRIRADRAFKQAKQMYLRDTETKT